MNLCMILCFFNYPLASHGCLFFAFCIWIKWRTRIYTLAVVSFSVGLVTEEVIQTLTNFTKEKLANKDSSTNDITTTKSVALKGNENKYTNISKEKDEDNK